VVSVNQQNINELHSLIENFAHSKGLSASWLLSFLTSTLIGTMEMRGYSDEFARETFDKMYDEFKKKREQT
jgi:hypothetical protein